MSNFSQNGPTGYQILLILFDYGLGSLLLIFIAFQFMFVNQSGFVFNYKIM